MMSDSDDDIADMRQLFLEEADAMLHKIEDALIPEDNKSEPAIITLFRCFHTIKGSAGFFGLSHVSSFAFTIESMLSEKKESAGEIDEALSSFLLRARNRLGYLISISKEYYEENEEEKNIDKAFEGEAKGFIHSGNSGSYPKDLIDDSQISQTIAEANPFTYHVYLIPDKDFLREGGSIISLISCARDRGHIFNLDMHPEKIPVNEEYNPLDCYFNPEFYIRTTDSYEQLIGCFSNYSNVLEIIVEPIVNNNPLPHVVKNDSIPNLENHENLILQTSGFRVSEQESSSSQDGVISAQLKTPTSTVRIDPLRIDRFLNLAGELVIAGVQMEQIIGAGSYSHILEPLTRLSRTISDVHESAMRLRMIPVGREFRRFKRLVHDLSLERKKTVHLILEGDDTELDRTVIEKIIDPMAHLIRNAMDHGIETPEERRLAGKNEFGTIRIRSFHSAGEVVVDVEDDGRGISRKKIEKKGVEMGILDPDHILSDNETINLIFEPGFSTISPQEGFSGRGGGVGLDVVRRSIESLHGSIEVKSEISRNTVFRIRLPLTLTTIEGLHVETGDVRSVISLDHVVECLSYDESHRDSDMIKISDESLLCIDLNELFGLSPQADGNRYSVIVAHGGDKVCLIVDRLVGQIESVVRPLHGYFENLSEYSGFTLLGDGSIGMILDLSGIIRSYHKRNEPQ